MHEKSVLLSINRPGKAFDLCPSWNIKVVRVAASLRAHSGQVIVRAAAPSADVTLTPLLPKRICSTPLAESLLKALQQNSRTPLADQSSPCSSLQHGFLTLDQGRSLVPLQAAEAHVRTAHPSP